MVRIVYQHVENWPDEGPLRVDATFRGEIPVSPIQARRRANGYLAKEVALFVVAGDPMLVLGEQPHWQIPAVLRLRGYGNLAEVGVVEVDALTGQIKALSDTEITTIREHAHEIASRLSAPTAAAS
jgi:hypothetical protein